MNILPIALTAAGAIPNIIGGIMSAVLAGKKLSGGRLRRHRNKRKMKKGASSLKKGKGLARLHRKGGKVKRHYKKRKMAKRGKGGKVRRHYKKKGAGVVADTLGNIPLLGALLGPLAKAFGGKLKRMPRRTQKSAIRALIHRLRGKGLSFHSGTRGKGLSPMYIRRPYVSSGCGLVPYGNAPYSRPSMGMIHAPRVGGRHGNTHRMSNTVRAILRGGGLSPMYIRRPYTGGRLSPVGIDYKGSPHAFLTPALASAALNKLYPGRRIAPYRQPIAGPGTKGIASIDSRDQFSYPTGGLIHRKGHLRKIKGKKHKVRVKPTVVGRGLLSPAGGYIPYGGHYGVYRR